MLREPGAWRSIRRLHRPCTHSAAWLQCDIGGCKCMPAAACSATVSLLAFGHINFIYYSKYYPGLTFHMLAWRRASCVCSARSVYCFLLDINYG